MGKRSKGILGKFISLSIVLTLLLAPMSVQAETTQTENTETKIANQNAQAAYQFSEFSNMFTTVQLKRNSQTQTVDYPDDYAGAYIDDDDVLHINYVEDDTNIVKDIISSDIVVYDVVDISYNTLLALYNAISDNMLELNVKSVYIDEINNCVNISTETEDQNAIIDFLNSQVNEFTFDAVVFSPAKENFFTDAGGSTLRSGSSIFTLGYNAYQPSTGKHGFITCGHGVSNGSQVSNSSGTVLGSVTNRTLSGKIDAAFVPYNDSSRRTPASNTGPDITGNLPAAALVTGISVSKYGYKTGFQDGKVAAASASVTVSGITFTDQVRLNIRQEGGDSGCPVVQATEIGPLLPGQIRKSNLIGIVTIASSDYSTAHASKAANINAAFGVNTYVRMT